MAYKDGGRGPKFNLEEMQKLPSSLILLWIASLIWNIESCHSMIFCVC